MIAYASRKLWRCESKYPAHKLEFLALKWAVTEKVLSTAPTSLSLLTASHLLTYSPLPNWMPPVTVGFLLFPRSHLNSCTDPVSRI